MNSKQQTIQTAVSISGVGLHTGQKVTITFQPAAENFGYQFKRTDLEGQPIVVADVDNVVDTARGTTIAKGAARVSTIEHALAALAGLEIDNVLMEIDGPEVPILDGSALPFIDLLLRAGIEKQEAAKEYYELKTTITYEDTERKVEMLAVPSEDFRITVMVDYNSPILGTQHATMYNIGEFKTEIAACRTFCFFREIEQMAKNNLIKGGDLDNAIVLVDKEVSDEELTNLAKLLKKPKIEVKKNGILNNTQLKYENEPARHKLLDIVGDLALIGMPIKGHFLAARPGHAANVAFAKKIKQLIKADKLKKDVPVYNPSAQPVYDINQISNMLPHRAPFLLIDKILELSDTHVVGLKNVTMNEWFFQGHFPGNPVMPGVLQIEAMAQTGGILVLNTVPDPENYWTYFMKIENARFKQRVLPGDTLIFKLRLASPIRRGICHMKGEAYVGDKVVMEAEMMAQIVKKT
jgi:UDP-3-O-[3-hydroxymyristoyl] N-acetylglucosamine deacetylase/3-hydroxyacyl-[acyl-carrier-protein] dehydratase